MSFLLREINAKCLAISGGIMLAYWLAPSINPLVLKALGVSSYAAIDWYDLIYDRDTKLISYDRIYPDLFSWMKPTIGDGNIYGGPIRGRRLEEMNIYRIFLLSQICHVHLICVHLLKKQENI